MTQTTRRLAIYQESTDRWADALTCEDCLLEMAGEVPEGWEIIPVDEAATCYSCHREREGRGEYTGL